MPKGLVQRVLKHQLWWHSVLFCLLSIFSLLWPSSLPSCCTPVSLMLKVIHLEILQTYTLHTTSCWVYLLPCSGTYTHWHHGWASLACKTNSSGIFVQHNIVAVQTMHEEQWGLRRHPAKGVCFYWANKGKWWVTNYFVQPYQTNIALLHNHCSEPQS